MSDLSFELRESWRLHWARFIAEGRGLGVSKSLRLDLAIPPFLGAAATFASERGANPHSVVADAISAIREAGTHEPWEVDAAAARIVAKHRSENPSAAPNGRPPPNSYGGPTSPTTRYWLAGTAIWLAVYLLWLYLVGRHRYWSDDPEPWVIALAPPALTAFAYRVWRWAGRR